ncbi:MAG: hypothetical protein HYX69_22755 [Planctomycetia bacterium]|nr:hypothetical protein [Planctomycetia bacterium]
MRAQLRSTLRRIAVLGGCAVAFGARPIGAYAQAPRQQILAYSGQAVPGVTGARFGGIGTDFIDYIVNGIDNNADVVFAATYGTTSPYGSDRAYFRWTDNSQTLARIGDLSPVVESQLSRGGDVVYIGNGTDLISVSRGTLISSTAAGGLFAVNTAGDVVYRIVGGPSLAAYRNGFGPSLIAVQGGAAPGAGVTLPADTVFDGGAFAPSPAMNGAGNTAFSQPLSSAMNAAIKSGVFKEVASGGGRVLVAVAHSAMAAPGTSGAVFDAMLNSTAGTVNVRSIGFNDAGSVVFRASLVQTGGVGNSNDTGIWSDRSGTLALVAREGDAAPGTASNHLGSFEPAVINHNGRIAFLAHYAEAPILNQNLTVINAQQGIFTAAPGGSPSLVATSGGTAPFSQGAKFVQFDEGFPSHFLATDLYGGHSPSINGAGQSMVFLATLNKGTELTPDFTQAIFSVDPYGNNLPVIALGDAISPGGVPSTIAQLRFMIPGPSGNEDGYHSALNDNAAAIKTGRFVYQATLADGRDVMIESQIILKGDANFDGIVDVSDNQVVASHWLQTGMKLGTNGDVNWDGRVDISDIQTIAQNYLHDLLGTGAGAGTGATVGVPEPSCLALAACGLAGFVCMLTTRRGRDRCQHRFQR